MFAKISKFFNKILFNKILLQEGSCEFKNNFKIFWLGGLLVLAFAPFNLFFFAIVSIASFFVIIDKIDTLKQVFWRSFFYCFGFFVFGIYWICNSLLIDFTKFAWLIPFAITLIPALMALYFGLAICLYKKLIRYFAIKTSYQKVILFSIFWLIFEVVRGNLFTGFPWNLLGYIWLFNQNFAQIASLVGVYGMSLLACLFSLVPLLFISSQDYIFANKISANKTAGWVLIFFLISSYIFGFFYIDKNYQNNLSPLAKLRLIQANIQQKDKWLDSEKYQNILKHIALTKSKNLDDIDAVIWSETSIPFVVDINDKSMMETLSDAIPRDGFLLSGGIRLERESGNKVWNSIFVFDKNGVTNNYDKQHLVPFGEYVPLHKYLSFLFIGDIVDKITGGGSGFTEGEGQKLINLPKFSFNPLLCYEVIFSSEVVDNKYLIPDLFINLTNDSWFGNSIGPYQHLQIAQMRAIEYGRQLLRVAQTGISANINHYGQVIDKIDLNQEGVIDALVFKSDFKTIYSKYAHLPLAIILILLLMIAIFPELKRDNLKKLKSKNNL